MSKVASAVESAVTKNLQNALAEMLTKSTTGVEKSIDFLSGQIPDIVQQLLTYKLISACVLNVLYILLIVGFVLLTKYLYKENQKFEQNRKSVLEDNLFFGATIVSSFVGMFFSVVLTIGIVSNTKTILMIWLAPKIYLIEYAATLVKGH